MSVDVSVLQMGSRDEKDGESGDGEWNLKWKDQRAGSWIRGQTERGECLRFAVEQAR